jgi:hypothetical protein
MPIPDTEKLFNEFEKLGELEVIKKRSQGVYAQKISVVDAWLSIKEEERKQAIKERELSIADKSANAAEKSAKLTRWNVLLTGIAVIVSIVSLYFSLKKTP